MAGLFCKADQGQGLRRVAIDKPPAQGFNYNSQLLTETKIFPNIAYPQVITRPLNGVFTFPVPGAIVGLWLASSMTNPNADTVGVFCGKIGAQQINIQNAANIYFQHVSISVNTISRTGGLSFGEYSGLAMNTGEQFGVFLTGSDPAVQITYALSIVWIQI